MSHLKSFFHDKAYGFYASIFVFVFSLVTAIVYVIGYHNSSDMSEPVLYAILAGLLLAVILAALKRYNWVPVVLALSDFAALLLFIDSIYFYVSVVLYGINGSAFSPAFLSSTVLLLLSLAFSVINIFLRQIKE